MKDIERIWSPALAADWPQRTTRSADRSAPAVIAFTTLRQGGVSLGPYGDLGGQAGLNLGARCGDDPALVQTNRAMLQQHMPGPIRWLNQVHGTAVERVRAPQPDHSSHTQKPAKAMDLRVSLEQEPVADAAVSNLPGVPLCVLTADCLPVFLRDDSSRVVGIAHAGWRGLLAGVIENTVAAMRTLDPSVNTIQACLGPAIGPEAFEVGADVYEAFAAEAASSASAFRLTGKADKWVADLYALARMRLARAGVTQVSGGNWCTVRDASMFYSHRRDRRSGRMANLIWIVPAEGRKLP